MNTNFREIANFIWSIADLLRDYYKRSKYADVILPFTILRRLDCVLEATKEEVLDKHNQYKNKLDDPSGLLKRASGYSFFNISRYDFQKLLDDPQNIKANIINFINGFSKNISDIIENFKLREQINFLSDKNLLYQVVERFASINLHPDHISNHDMGYVFEELIRRFNEQTNENPGEHFTPREIIRLMVNMLFSKDKEELSKPGKIVTVYDPACGTGGMLTIAKDHILEQINSEAIIELFGQELNPETFATSKSDMLIKGENADNIKPDSSFSHDGFINSTFDYILSNPPYGKDWKQDSDSIKSEYERGTAGRFEAGLPRINDGQLLFLQHMISKMHQKDSGEVTRIAIVFNGSPLFTGDAGGGESEIRRWIIENDWLEAIIALPDQLFYNTGIYTYIWVLTNKKQPEKKGKISLINATDMYVKMRKSLGNKRNEISPEQIKEITELYLDNLENGRVKIFDSSEFGYRKVTIDRPLKLSFQASEDRIAKLDQEKAFSNLAQSKKKKDPQLKLLEEKEGKELQEKIKEVLSSMDGKLYKNYNEFTALLEKSMKQAGVSISSSVRKAIINALSERDEIAYIVTNSKGKPEVDSDLRDYENVPLNGDVWEYFEREVKPHVPDAWINESVKDTKDKQIGRVGYEINFNKYFFKYQPPRALEYIDKDIKAIQKEIFSLIEDVTE